MRPPSAAMRRCTVRELMRVPCDEMNSAGEFADVLGVALTGLASSCSDAASRAASIRSTGVVVTLTVDKLDAMLTVPLVMLVVDELCRANLWATVVLNTNAIPSTVAVAA